MKAYKKYKKNTILYNNENIYFNTIAPISEKYLL